MKITKEKIYIGVGIVIVVGIIVGLVYMMKKKESFGKDTRKFVSVGEERYGLRGERINTYNIGEKYIKSKRKIVLNESGGEKWKSSNKPEKEGIKGCKEMKCPENGEYDEEDKCYMC